MGQQPGAVDTTCGSLLRELQRIWDEVGENDSERDKMLLHLEQECLEVYRRKVDNANQNRARLHQILACADDEFAAIFSALGEPVFTFRERRSGTLKEQVASIGPRLEEVRKRKEERVRQFSEVKSQISVIRGEIAGSNFEEMYAGEEQDLTVRSLEEYHAQLATLQNEKSERVHKVLKYVNLIHHFCSVMGMKFSRTVAEVHPSLADAQGLSGSITTETLDRLVKTIQSLEVERNRRISKINDLGASMVKLWSLMDTPVHEQRMFEHVTCYIAAEEEEITTPNSLSFETLQQAEIELERLQVLKISKMKELVLKKRVELEEFCRTAHMESDPNTAPDRVVALIESGMVDAADLLTKLEGEINKAKEEVTSRKDIMILMEKWMSACEEEGWLEDYNKDENRFASKGAHLNLKRAEKARAAIAKLPALVDSLTQKTRSWEESRNIPFMFDGVRLLAMLNEYNRLREEKEEEKRRFRDQKKLQEQMLNEKETLFGSKPSPSKNTINPRRVGISSRASSIVGSQHSLSNRRLSLGNAIMHPGTSELTRNGNPTRLGSTSKDSIKPGRPKLAAPSNYVSINKEDANSAGGKNGVVARSQPQAQESVATRQTVNPFPSAPVLQQLHVDVAGNRAAASSGLLTTSVAYMKSPLKTALSGSLVSDLENITPRLPQSLEYSFEERRASAPYGNLLSNFWKGGKS